MKNKHYELKKIYYGLLANDPDYPAWQDFECLQTDGYNWHRMTAEPSWHEESIYRYNPLPKKWEPKNGWIGCPVIRVSEALLPDDYIKLQAYATKLSWIREQKGYEFKPGEKNYLHFCISSLQEIEPFIDDDRHPYQDIIYMNKEHADMWAKMFNNGEV